MSDNMELSKPSIADLIDKVKKAKKEKSRKRPSAVAHGEDHKFVHTIFPDGLLEGCIVKLKIGGDYGCIMSRYIMDTTTLTHDGGVSRLSIFNTLILEDLDTSTVLLVFQENELEPMRLSDDVEVLSQYNIPTTFKVRTRKQAYMYDSPYYEGHDYLSKMPDPLMKTLSGAKPSIKEPNNKTGRCSCEGKVKDLMRKVESLQRELDEVRKQLKGEMGSFKDVGDMESTYDVHDFLSENYNQGGMIPLKEVRKHPNWRKENEKDLEIKLVHLCKSCGAKGIRGCCSKYHRANRTTTMMLIGWSSTL